MPETEKVTALSNAPQAPAVEEPKVVPVQRPSSQIVEIFAGSEAGKYIRFTMAALSSLPWVGILSAVANFQGEVQQEKVNNFIGLWMQEYQGKMVELGTTIKEILLRFDALGPEIKERIESPEYLTLVRKAFHSWDQADTQEKRQMIKKLLMNAGGTKLCPDDLIRLFISWIDQYHEAHFQVIAEIYRNPGISRGQIWDNIRPERPFENSAEADLYRYLIRDLSTGGVIRQAREVNDNNEFVRKSTRGQRPGHSSRTMESAFEETKPYELTELGSQFVHYVMNDLVPRIE